MLQDTELSPPPDSAPPPAPEAGPAPTADGCMRTWAKRLGPAGPLAAVMVCLPVVGGVVLLGFLRQLGPWLKAHRTPEVAVGAAGAIAGLIGFSLVPTYMLEMLAGWAFGAWVGLAVAVVGITGAATIGFFLSKWIVKGYVLHTVHDNAKCEAVRKAMLESGPFKAGLIVGLLRLAPIVPFGATNLLMASAGCHPVPFALGTAAGSIPRTAAIVFMSAEMAQLDFRQEPGFVIGSLIATVVVVCIIGWIAKRALAQVTEGAADDPDAAAHAEA
jgi:uncharacterized membrane protein YdjX (TVP38/TMEM64 family)